MRSASYRTRLNRRSTTRCTRRRAGLNRAATASVDAATATGEFAEKTCLARSTSPAYTPTSSPVTIAYASVRLMIRSISYSRYFKMATPMPAGSAAIPMRTTPPTTCQAPPAAPIKPPAMNEMRAATPPAISQVRCWRTSPADRRQLTT